MAHAVHQLQQTLDNPAIPAVAQSNAVVHALQQLLLITEQHAALEIAEELIAQEHATLRNHAL